MSEYRTVIVTAEIADNIIEVTPTVASNVVSVDADVVTQVVSVDAEQYTGEYTFTPTADTQTIEISGMIATQDITINPIPSNYGLITWSGSVLTIT